MRMGDMNDLYGMEIYAETRLAQRREEADIRRLLRAARAADADSAVGRFGGRSGYSMEVFADRHREGLREEAGTRRTLKATRLASETERAAHAPRWGAVGRALAWLARLARPDRHAAAS